MTSTDTLNQTLTRTKMLTQVVAAIEQIEQEIKTKNTYVGEHDRELARLKRLHDDLHWFNAEY